MPKYWGKQIFSLGSFSEVGQKTEKKKRPKVGNNNGQLRIATTPQVAHAKPPGPIITEKTNKCGAHMLGKVEDTKLYISEFPVQQHQMLLMSLSGLEGTRDIVQINCLGWI